MKNLNFTAVDFETMTAELTSACSVGVVKVQNGTLCQKFYSLLKPIPDDKVHVNTAINGITLDMVKSAPTFKEIYDIFQRLIGNDLLVCHNAGTDINIIRRCTDFYNLPKLENDYEDTYKITGKSLVDSCECYGISDNDHHDALADAEMCAKVYLCCQGVLDKSDISVFDRRTSHEEWDKKRLDHDTLMQLDLEQVENKDTLFFNKKVVLTGVLDSFPERSSIANVLRKCGADINTSISKFTDIVIMGHKAGPKKIEKIQTLIDDGNEIRIIREPELIEILKSI